MARKAKAKPADPNAEVAGELTEKYINLRQKIRDLDAMHIERMKPLREKLDEYGSALLEKLDESGVDSMATKLGTAYRTTRTTAAVEDGEAFIDFIIDEGYIDLLERKASVKAVQEYLEEHEELPPGVKLNSVVAIGVRKKS